VLSVFNVEYNISAVDLLMYVYSAVVNVLLSVKHSEFPEEFYFSNKSLKFCCFNSVKSFNFDGAKFRGFGKIEHFDGILI